MRGGVDVLMIAADVQGAGLALREVRRQGLRLPMVGSDGMVGIESEGPLAEGLHCRLRISRTVRGAECGVRGRFFRSTQGERPNDVAGLTYDIVQLLAQGIAAVGFDRRALRDYLASVGSRRPAFEGVSGRIAFDANGDVPGKPLTIAIVRNGRLVAEASE
jgi:branched-chain amino acid transport system substrate-binding protein